MIRRFSLLTSLTILFIFLLEIFFVYYLPELYASSRVAVVEYTTVSGTVIPHAPFPSDRRKTAPEIRKYTQNTFRYVFAIPQYLVPYIPG